MSFAAHIQKSSCPKPIGHVLAIVDTVIRDYIKKNQMFTVYQIWFDASDINKSTLNYDAVRSQVEHLINDSYSQVNGWTRSIGYHLGGLNNKVGNVGAPPQIYHPVGADITQYDPTFRLNNNNKVKIVKAVSSVVKYPRGVLITTPPSQRKTKGLFKFKVWVNGVLENCSFVNRRGNGGKFVSSPDYEGYGVLDNGLNVVVRQDNDGKLYAVKGE